ncbi:AcrR family transcriptional regulator [Actinoplanes lutulentus]|uniref:TetR family transcriptional regulator n=1 Tax=Actinoplanes lutulentus TaxID=1287878 RepID=A0A327YWI2_9ACTN|nr:TetR/AcrR family transcriptional regulator [Actinoplanes lutulentus]MBB2940464.1 AcrR family transcriptional regulator [Actinoplanes lutulentus]RAK25804.1 TetR family transcriptional regulator [Actinoplanes lutulentus]
MSENRRVRERRRAALIAAARELFLERGVEHVTIDEIADRCAVTRRTVYRYFATRDQVALAVEIDVLQRWSALLQQRAGAWTGTGAQQLRTAFADIGQLVDDAADELRFTRVFDAQSISGDDTELGGQYRDVIREVLAPIVAVLRLGQDDGTLTLAVPPELTASTLTNAYLGLAQRVYGRGDQLAKEQEIDPRLMLVELTRIYLAGLESA